MIKQNLRKLCSKFSSSIKYSQSSVSEDNSIYNSATVNLEFESGIIERIEVLPSGIIRLYGYLTKECKSISGIRFNILCNDKEVQHLNTFRFKRIEPKKPEEFNYLSDFSGIVFEYDGQVFSNQIISKVIISYKDASTSIYLNAPVIRAHYSHLFNSKEVYKRGHLYTSGLPVPVAPPYVKNLLKDFSGPILDFGCGRGNLISLMVEQGKDCSGIEIDRREIHDSLLPDVKDRITLYDGKLPLPYKTNSFETVVSFEVLEHIPDFQLIIKELARVTNSSLIISVPDMSGIPLCHSSNVVPWHLLEGTHVNFFNQHSLFDVLTPYFSSIDFIRVGYSRVNNTSFYTSLVAICSDIKV